MTQVTLYYNIMNYNHLSIYRHLTKTTTLPTEM